MSDLKIVSYKLPYRDLKGSQTIMSIQIRGVLDFDTAPKLEKVLDDCLDQRIYRFILDLEFITYLSSAGVGVFINLRRTLQEHHGQVVFIHPSPPVRVTLGLFEFDRFATITDNMKTALDELRGKGEE